MLSPKALVDAEIGIEVRFGDKYHLSLLNKSIGIDSVPTASSMQLGYGGQVGIEALG